MKVKILRTTKYRRAPPECVHLVSGAFGMQDTHIRINTPPIFIVQQPKHRIHESRVYNRISMQLIRY